MRKRYFTEIENWNKFHFFQNESLCFAYIFEEKTRISLTFINLIQIGVLVLLLLNKYKYKLLHLPC